MAVVLFLPLFIQGMSNELASFFHQTQVTHSHLGAGQSGHRVVPMAAFRLRHTRVFLEVKFGLGFNQVEVLFSADLIWRKQCIPNFI